MPLPEYETYLSIYKRPHMDTFLNYLGENTELVVFSYGTQPFVDTVLVVSLILAFS